MVDEIRLTGLGKRFNGRWLFRHVKCQWKKGDRIAIIGSNGSGKSSLTAIIAGYMMPSEGDVVLCNNGQTIAEHEVWKHISWTSPALELPEQMSYLELFEQVKVMRGFHASFSMDKMEEWMGLTPFRNQPLKSFSSGMRQRVKLILAFAVQSDVLILDEPTAHLDQQGIAWFAALIKEAQQSFIFVASNSNADETFFCNQTFDVTTCDRV
ncbi:MAG: hypothetical protein RLY35_1221 [Bacteroidota bacterium]|jgi:ABC-type multidrug transport system ATPase subunit